MAGQTAKTKTRSNSTASTASSSEGRCAPLYITDTTLRDAHQSLWATRMRTADILGIIDVVDNAGFYSLEVWGGATFDVCLRYLRENPWERLRLIKAKTPKTPLQMLLRGQNILGYRNYPDDLLDRFVDLACQNGVDIFRIFDALNDNRNLERAVKAVKRNGAHAQGTLCYTISPVHTVEAFAQVAKEQEQMGVDSICIKDMAGILSPIMAGRLVSALVKTVSVPIQVHCHATSGMAVASYVESVRAGAGAIDCAISILAGSSSQPPVETMLAIFSDTDYQAKLDIECLRKMCRYFTDLAPKRQPSAQTGNAIDPEIMIHHIPGGMISNLRSQLQQQDALNRISEVFEELPRARADMGYPPLVTPTSQIVGVQAVLNVLSGERYAIVPQETKDYVKGLYGKSPVPIAAAIREKILGNDQPVTCRPADLLKPILPSVTRDVDPSLIQAEEDILSYALFPEPALEYFRWRALPASERGPIPADLEVTAHSSAAKVAPPAQPPMAESDAREIKGLLEKVNALNIQEITIRHGDVNMTFRSGLPAVETVRPASATPTSAAPTRAAAPAQQAVAAPPTVPALTIDAPLNGTLYRTASPSDPEFARPGDVIEAGAPVCIVEAMKLFNQIKAPFRCKILRFLVNHSQPVKKGQAIVEIEKA